MRPLIAPALLLWGLQVDMLPVALVMAVVIEGPRLVRARLAIEQRDFERLWNLTAVLFLGVVFALLLMDRGLGMAGSLLGTAPSVEPSTDGAQRISSTALTFLRWMPVILLPFTLAHAWSTSTVLPWSTFSLYEQARARREPLVPPPTWAVQPVHPGVVYLVVVLFACLTHAEAAPWVFPLWVAVVLLALAPARPRHYHPLVLVPMILLLVGGAWLARLGHTATGQMLEALHDGFGQVGGGIDDGRLDERATALGAVGRLQLSHAMVLRGEAPPGQAPERLTEAVLDRFNGRSWNSSTKTFEPWPLPPEPPDPQVITIVRSTLAGRAALAIPTGAAALALPSGVVAERNALGSARIEGAGDVLIYHARPGAMSVAPPTAEDLRLDQLPPTDRAALATVARELATDRTPVAAISAWLDTHGRYRLDQEAVPPDTTPVAHFLTTTRQGHCEFFAAAVVLLARQSGVPARYAVGYMPESDPDGTWRARGRHAHAWALVWDGMTWQVVDATPGTWQAEVGPPWHEGVTRWWDEGWYRLDRWRAAGGNWRPWVFAIGLCILAYIGWRQVRGSRWARAMGTGPAVAGQESELRPWLERLERRHGPRPPAEPLVVWMARLPVDPAWREAVDLHTRLRFDPAGLNDEERRRLRNLVRQCS